MIAKEMEDERLQNDRRNNHKRWRKDDEQYIRRHISESNISLAKKFGRTVGAVRTLKEKIRKAEKDEVPKLNVKVQ